MICLHPISLYMGVGLMESTVDNLMWLKISVVGESGVGKTSLVKQFCENKFSSACNPTVGADYGHKHCSLNEQEVEVTFWDLPGGSEYHRIRKELLPGSQICLLVIDVDNLTNEVICNWLKEIYNSQVTNITILVNKSDLIKTQDKEREIMAKVKEIEMEHKLNVKLTTAKTNESITELLTILIKQTI